MIFDALLNATHRVSLRGPGAQLEGSYQWLPFGWGKIKRPSRARFNATPAMLEESIAKFTPTNALVMWQPIYACMYVHTYARYVNALQVTGCCVAFHIEAAE